MTRPPDRADDARRAERSATYDLRPVNKAALLRPNRLVRGERQPSVLSLDFLSAGSFDVVPLLQGRFTETQLSWKISDHYPLWAEFSIRA